MVSVSGGSSISILIVLYAAGLAAIFFLWKSRRQLQKELRSVSVKTETLSEKLEEGSQSSVEQSDRLAAILESMTEGVVAVDGEQKILLLNSALARSFSFEKGVAVGRFFWEMFRDPDINEMIKNTIQSRRSVRREHEALLSGRVFEIQMSPVFTGDDFLGVVCVFRDVTLFKEFDRLRSDFVANVSHELKTPLTSILGFVETLKEGGVEDAENRMKFLQIIEDQSKHLHLLIENLLYLSRLESSKEPLRREPVDLGALLSRVQQVFSPLLRDNRVDLQTEVSAPLTVMAEGSSLERALSNLIDNAVKYSRPGGWVKVKAFRDAEGTKIQVSDNGIGISTTDLGRIFERFYRVDKSRSREHGGTGLGLSIVKHILERHGGKIDVESSLGQGTTFSLTLPGRS